MCHLSGECSKRGFQIRRLAENFWVGGGETNSGGGGLIGAISTSNGVNAASIASNIFNDLRAKELIGAAGT
jgi:hypothetical protein